MPSFSKRSKDRLNTCHENLQILCNEVIKDFDFTVICGHRGEADQNRAYESGLSELKYPDSKHNTIPSLAVDIAPYSKMLKGIDWNDQSAFKELAACMKFNARKLGIRIRWGGEFSRLKDLVHFELI
jgi:peptidoglycan L-alanyl-D-glutamate endopeptidase CwlK